MGQVKLGLGLLAVAAMFACESPLPKVSEAEAQTTTSQTTQTTQQTQPQQTGQAPVVVQPQLGTAQNTAGTGGTSGQIFGTPTTQGTNGTSGQIFGTPGAAQGTGGTSGALFGTPGTPNNTQAANNGTINNTTRTRGDIFAPQPVDPSIRTRGDIFPQRFPQTMTATPSPTNPAG
jgi:hypothetical protein